MRIAFSVVFSVFVALLVLCIVLARKSHKPIGKPVALFVSSLITPVVGNLFIIASIYETLSLIGCYLYFLGMNYVMFAFSEFTIHYCNIPMNKTNKSIKYIAYTFLILDSIQLLVNIATHHAFGIEALDIYNSTYYRFIPYIGETIHRSIDYVILADNFAAFIVKLIRSPRTDWERYIVIILAMVAVSAWQTFYIFSRTPVDISMTGFAIFGFLVFYFSIYYRPLRLLDRFLAAIASKMTEAILFFDNNNRCIWANTRALNLLKIDDGELDNVSNILNQRFELDISENDLTKTFIQGTGDAMESYAIEKHKVADDKMHIVGSYISIRDNTEEQKKIEKESYNATHDALTKVLNRAGYDALMDSIELEKCFLILLDIDSFKEANDKYGHITGDKVLMKMVEIIQNHFRVEDDVCRIGGDEFAIIIKDINEETVKFVKSRIRDINKELKKSDNELPLCSISAGGAFGKDAENSYELFNNADHALYETKFNGKCGFTLFNKR